MEPASAQLQCRLITTICHISNNDYNEIKLFIKLKN
jgi:hypothetical protein